MAGKTTSYLILSTGMAALLWGCSTSLVNRSPLDIASSSVRRTDVLSGISEVLAPQIKAFGSSRSFVNGQLQLRTAGPFTDDKGIVQTGGAYLDILINYATATPNPEDALVFDEASWPGGEPALVADFGQSVLNCTERAREIFRPALGYTGYYPRYGHSGHYGGYHRGYGHGGYGSHDGGNGGDHDDHDDGDEDGYDEHDHDMDGTIDEGHDTADHDADGTQPSTRRPRGPRDDETGPGTAPEVDPVIPSRRQPGHVSRPLVRAGHTGSKPVVSEPAPSSRSNVQVSRPRPAPVSRPASRPTSKPASRPTTSRTGSSTDRSFRNTNNSRTRTRSNVRTNSRYHPHDPYFRQGYSEYKVTYSCDRQESLRVFIPRERLVAAERKGLVLYVRPRTGLEETIVLPPNYISGFMMAAYSPESGRSIQTVPETALKTPDQPSSSTPIIYGDP